MASSFQNPGDYGNSNSELASATIAVSVICVCLTTSLTAARMINRQLQSCYHTEDYLSVVTWALSTAYISVILSAAVWGAGQHIWNVPPSQALKISKSSWAVELLNCATILNAKTALLLQLRRIFAPRTKSAVHVAILTIMWINIAFYIASFVAVAVQCVPTERIWDPTITTGHCIDIYRVMLGSGLFNIISDVSIFILPIWTIWHLHIDLKKKLAVFAVFGTGLFAVISSICRIVYTFPVFTGIDATYHIAPLAMWTEAELTSIILCTSFPLMPGFVRIVRSKLREQKSQLSDDSTRTAVAEKDGSAIAARKLASPDDTNISVTFTYSVEERSDDGDSASQQDLFRNREFLPQSGAGA